MSFVFTSRAQLDVAVSAWCADSAAATVTYGAINTWNVSAITNMNNLFAQKSTFNSDISAWNVSNVTAMSAMFSEATAFDQPLNTWNVSQVTDMADMFTAAVAFNQPLNSWNVSSVTAMGVMFFMASAFNQPLNSWNVSNVIYLDGMFNGASAFNQNIRGWSVGATTALDSMFYDATAMIANQGASETPVYTWFNQAPPAFAPATKLELQTAVNAWCSNSAAATVTYGDINTWNVSAITDMSTLFQGKSTFNSIINSWNVSSVTNMNQMFSRAYAFDSPLSMWNVSNVRDMSYMFDEATAFDTYIDLWNVSSVTNMAGMFYYAESFKHTLGLWNVSNVRDMSYMFSSTTLFNNPINSWIVSSVTDMSGMFEGAVAFNQPLNSWNVSQVTNMNGMFSGSVAFDQNIRMWAVGAETTLVYMFADAGGMGNQGVSATPVYTYFNQTGEPAPTPPAPTGPALESVAFVLTQLNASYELSQALSIIGDYTPPDSFAFPTITLSMPASQFNDGLFQLELVDSNINTLVNPATESVYFSEKIIYYADQAKLPLLKDYANVMLKDLPVVNGTALKPLRQRVAGVDGLGASMVHELAFQAIGVSLMDDQIDNGAALKASIDAYLTTSLPAFVRAQLAACHGKTQNIAGASDLTTRANVSRELFMQIVESVVGGVNPVTGNARSSRLNSLFDGSNLVGGKYGIKFIAGDTLRFSITISPYSVGGVVQDIDYIVDGVQHVKQEARTVELVIVMTDGAVGDD